MIPLLRVESRHSIIKSFQFALEGFYTAFSKGRNFRIQVALFLVTIAFGIFFDIAFTEWLDVFIVAGTVLILELLNTSLESIVDMVSPEIRPKAKVAKDVAAAAVLVASFIAVLIAAFIFIPKLLKLFLGI